LDISELERRAAEVLSNMVTVGDDGEARLSPDFEILHRDIKVALQESGDIAELNDIAQAMNMMKETLSNPEIARTIVENQARPLEPQPEIFDAIEDCDVGAVRTALRNWEINKPVGKYEATALYHAMSCLHETSLEVITLLLDEGADPNRGLTDTNVLHGLGFANLQGIEPGDLVHVVRRCIELGADIEQRTNRLQWTPLITAVSEWNPVATEALLLGGADIRARAGDVEGVCYAGADCIAFADGHEETLAALNRFMKPS
jgi:hypothetical protein